jgi:hypothetical protein
MRSSQGLKEQQEKHTAIREPDNLRLWGFVTERIYKKPEKLKHSTKPLLYNYLAFDFTRNCFIFENWKCALKDVIAVELIKDSSVVQSASARQDGWSVSGGIVPGMGMITGSAQMNSGEKSSMIAVSVLLNCTNLPSVVIPFLFAIADKASEEYQNAVTKAYEVYSIFESTVRRNKK